MPKIIEDEQIFRAVMQTVVERGYTGATTRQMAEAAGVSEVTLFRKYGKKAQLVKEAIASIMAQMDFDSATRYSGDVAADLLQVVKTYQASADEYGQFYAIILSEIPRHPELADLLDTPLPIVEDIGRLMARYQAEGVLNQEHPVHAVLGLLGPLIATNMIRGSLIRPPLPPVDLHNHVDLFLDGRMRPV